jgi:hypothetical protein
MKMPLKKHHPHMGRKEMQTSSESDSETGEASIGLKNYYN